MTPSMLLTGGSGRLGQELVALMPDLRAPSRQELDLTRPETITSALDQIQPQLVIHAAAYTNVAGAEQDRGLCWQTNVEGTRQLVQQVTARDLFLVHISTDYVFPGTTGQYKEEDPVGPVRNYYSLSKLVAEEIARCTPHHLVIRTSFRPRQWPYPVAFTDIYTSQDYVDVIAPEIRLALDHWPQIPYSTLHIATERKSVYELARRRKPDVKGGLKAEAKVDLPEDISLDISRWQTLKQSWGV